MKIFNKIFTAVFSASLLTPFVVGAAGYTCNASTLSSVEGQICNIIRILNQFIIPLLIAGALVWFIAGVVKYMMAHDEDERKKGREQILYGVIGFAVIIGVWGLVQILTTTFGLNNTNVTPNFPTL